MPIGKNAIKRVNNNGYSNVKTTAPDMENSIVNEAKKADLTEEKKTDVKKKSTAAGKPKTAAAEKANKTTSAKTATPKPGKKASAARTAHAQSKKPETEPELAPVKTLEKAVDSTQREGDGYINLGGGNLPYYLL